MKAVSAEEFDRVFDEGEQDMVEYVDLSSVRRPGEETKRVNVDLPVWMIDSLDKEARRVGVARQAVIKIWLDERLSTAKSAA
ncbi:MAG: BrnA antitoxin family protein [Propionibacteriaceae bacterium]|nr:BrnA antitoxin family protein [Propionibacteriaceae bacterium]